MKKTQGNEADFWLDPASTSQDVNYVRIFVPKSNLDLQVGLEWKSRLVYMRSENERELTRRHSCAPRTKFDRICTDVYQLACGVRSGRLPLVGGELSPCCSV